MSKMQQTIKENISFSGAGIHTVVLTNMTLKPAKEDTGIRFFRVDLKGNPEIKADVANVFATERSTSLKKEMLKFIPLSIFLLQLLDLE